MSKDYKCHFCNTKLIIVDDGYECERCDEFFEACDECGGNELVADSDCCYYCKQD